MSRQRIRSKDELVAPIFELLDHNDAVAWENDTAYSFLQALADWLDRRSELLRQAVAEVTQCDSS